MSSPQQLPKSTQFTHNSILRMVLNDPIKASFPLTVFLFSSPLVFLIQFSFLFFGLTLHSLESKTFLNFDLINEYSIVEIIQIAI